MTVAPVTFRLNGRIVTQDIDRRLRTSPLEEDWNKRTHWRLEMNRIHLSSSSRGVLALVFAIVLFAGAPATAQDARTTPRAADGRPDLGGVWDFRTVTPLERPSELAGREFLTDEEAAEFEYQTVQARNADLNREQVVTDRQVVNGTTETADLRLAYNEFWWDRGTKVVGTGRTSLVVDPPDGLVPALTSDGLRRQAARTARNQSIAEGPEDRPLAERCILGFNSGPPMLPGGYNQNVHLLQTPDHVVLVNEMVHNARIVPLDGRPHSGITQWTGDSRGHWDGDTLVVETKNFLRETSFRDSGASLHLVERFTRVDADTLIYQFTVTDPTTWATPWTVEMPMTKTDVPMYEYACHEGNYGLEGSLSGARAVERETSTSR